MNLNPINLALPGWWKIVAGALLALSVFTAYKIHDHRVASEAIAKERAAKQAEYDKANKDFQAKAAPLIQKLNEDQVAIEKLKQEKRHEIVKYVHDRACFDPVTVRLLNSPLTLDGHLSEAPSGPIAKGAGGLAASDRDTADWIIDARAKYQVVSKKLNKLIDLVK